MKLGALTCVLVLAPFGVYACSSSDTTEQPDGGTVVEQDSSTVIEQDGETTLPDGAKPETDGSTTIPDGAPLPDGAPDPNPFAGVIPAVHLSTTDATAMGLGYMDGLVWAAGSLYITDPYAESSAGHVWKLPRVGTEPPVVRPSSATVGLCFDPANGGSLVLTETNPPAVARRTVASPGDSRTAVTSSFNALGFNSPNDCEVVTGKGVYFTDPMYPGDVQPMERVYLASGSPTVTTEIAAFAKGMHPNGIAVSKDGATLFVSLTGENQIVKIGLKADGSAVGAPTVFAATGGSPDGMAVDGVGNVYVATTAGVEAYSASGTKWGTLALPSGQVPTSLAFGGADSKTLFVGSTMGRNIGQAAIYKFAMREAGLP